MVESSQSPSQLDREIHDLLNAIRANPILLIPHLTEMLTRFNGKILSRPGDIDLRTNEGSAVVEETIAYLKKLTPILTPLTWNDHLWKSTRDHVKDQGPKSLTGHNGSDGSTPQKRMERYCSVMSSSGENISYGKSDAMGVLVQLIVDDGVPSRGHRENIFNPGWKVHGCCSGPHG